MNAPLPLLRWIIGYDVDSFLDFSEVYDLLGALVGAGRLASLQFGGENINAVGARHLAGITSLQVGGGAGQWGAGRGNGGYMH